LKSWTVHIPEPTFNRSKTVNPVVLLDLRSAAARYSLTEKAFRTYLHRHPELRDACAVVLNAHATRYRTAILDQHFLTELPAGAPVGRPVQLQRGIDAAARRAGAV
jgi:hypothetical protein